VSEGVQSVSGHTLISKGIPYEASFSFSATASRSASRALSVPRSMMARYSEGGFSVTSCARLVGSHESLMRNPP
jgi:hypothetical protein